MQSTAQKLHPEQATNPALKVVEKPLYLGEGRYSHMTTAYELQEIKKAVCGRTERRPATDAEIDYVLSLDPLAEMVEADEWSLYWDDGQCECSTQRPWGL